MNPFERHVRLANKAIEAYTPVLAPEYEPEDPQTVLTDLLADLMHWADTLEGVSVAEAYHSALPHHLYETMHPEEETPWAHKD
jgi:hypothetical protein